MIVSPRLHAFRNALRVAVALCIGVTSASAAVPSAEKIADAVAETNQRIAEASDCIELRYILKSEEHAELIVPAQINAGFRVPVTWFMAEDFEPISRIGDRTLSRYRAMAVKALGDGAVPSARPADPVRTVLQEVLDEFERVQLLLRLSPRWREKYAD